MADDFEIPGNRRTGNDRRKRNDRRSGKDRRSGADRRTGRDRRSGWGKIKDDRLEGALTTAATVAHLFSQPLTIIIGHIDLLLSSTEDENTKNKLEIIKGQLQSLSITMKDLRKLREYKTIDLDGLTLLDMDLRKSKKFD